MSSEGIKAGQHQQPALRLRLRTCLVVTLVLLVACGSTATSTPAPPPVVLRIGFAESLQPLRDVIMPIYGDEAPAESLEIQTGHATRLLSDLRLEQMDAVFVLGEPAAEEGWWMTPVAIEGLALVVNPENQASGLTLSQVQDVFQGRIWSWETLGGAAANIQVVTREEYSAAWELFQQLAMEEHRVTLAAVVMPDSAAVLDYVSSNPWAIGYVTAAFLDGGVKPLAVEGLFPLLDTLQDQSYPFHFPVYFVAYQDPTGPGRRLPAWLLSRDGQAVIGRVYGRVR